MRRRDRIASAQLQEAARELEVVATMVAETAKFMRAVLIAVGGIPPTAEDLAPRTAPEAAARAPRPAHLRVVRDA